MTTSTSLASIQQPCFMIGDKVKVSQERAPAEWRSDWKGTVLYVVGITPKATPLRGTFSGWEYWLSETPEPRRGEAMDGWFQDHLEAA